MRTGRSALAAVLGGTIALGVLAAQPAQAADTGIKVSKVVVNKGKPIVVGTTETKYPTISFRVTWPAGHTISTASAMPFMYHGTTAVKAYEGRLYGSAGDRTVWRAYDVPPDLESERQAAPLTG